MKSPPGGVRAPAARNCQPAPPRTHGAIWTISPLPSRLFAQRLKGMIMENRIASLDRAHNAWKPSMTQQYGNIVASYLGKKINETWLTPATNSFHLLARNLALELHCISRLSPKTCSGYLNCYVLREPRHSALPLSRIRGPPAG